MPTVARLAVSVTANTGKFTKGMDRSRRGLKGFSRDAKKATLVTRTLSKALIAAGGALGAFALARGIIRAAKSVEVFNQAMNSSLAIMGDVSHAMRTRMTRAAIEVAKVTKFAGDEVAKAYFFLASAGLTAEQSIAALPLVAKFAQAGMFDLAKATDLVTDAQSALGLTVKDPIRNLKNMTRVADVLVKANTLANASVEQFSEALTRRAATSLKTYGISLEEGIGVLAAFADQNIKGAEAGTAFDIALRELTIRSILNAAAFRKHNIQVWENFGVLRKVSAMVADLERALEGASAKTKKMTLMELGFQQRSVSLILALVGMSEKMRDVEQATLDAGGTVEDVAARQMTALDTALQHLSGSWLQMKMSMTPAIEKFAALVEWSAKFTDEMMLGLPIVRLEIVRIATSMTAFGDAIKQAMVTDVRIAMLELDRLVGKMSFLRIAMLEIHRVSKKQIGLWKIIALTIGRVFPIRPKREPVMGPPAPPPQPLGPPMEGIMVPRLPRGANFAAFSAPIRGLRIFASAMWDEWNEKLDEFNQKVKSVAGIVQGVLQRAKTPAERFREVLDAINITLAAGKITAEQYGKALRQAKTELEQRVTRLAPAVQGLLQRAKTPAERFREVLDAINTSLATGKINAEQYGRALGQARTELAQRLKAMMPARTPEFQQVALSRVALQGVNTPGRPQIVSDPQLADTNAQLRLIRTALSITRFGLTS